MKNLVVRSLVYGVTAGFGSAAGVALAYWIAQKICDYANDYKITVEKKEDDTEEE